MNVKISVPENVALIAIMYYLEYGEEDPTRNYHNFTHAVREYVYGYGHSSIYHHQDELQHHRVKAQEAMKKYYR